MSYFHIYMYKAIRKVLFLPILTERSYFCFLMNFNKESNLGEMMVM